MWRTSKPVDCFDTDPTAENTCSQPQTVLLWKVPKHNKRDKTTTLSSSPSIYLPPLTPTTRHMIYTYIHTKHVSISTSVYANKLQTELIDSLRSKKEKSTRLAFAKALKNIIQVASFS